MRTLYKTSTPTNYEDGEYFQPRLEPGFANGKRVFFVRETHGYWSDAEKKLINLINIASVGGENPDFTQNLYCEAF